MNFYNPQILKNNPKIYQIYPLIYIISTNYNKSFDGVNYEKTILIINHINFINGRGQFIQL